VVFYKKTCYSLHDITSAAEAGVAGDGGVSTIVLHRLNTNKKKIKKNWLPNKTREFFLNF